MIIANIVDLLLQLIIAVLIGIDRRDPHGWDPGIPEVSI